MAFTEITVQGSFTSASDPAAGTVTFTLCQPISNDGEVLPCEPTTATLDGSGAISVVLVATDDTDTVPQGVWYGVTEQISGAQPRDYFIEVSATGPNPLTLTPPSALPWQ